MDNKTLDSKYLKLMITLSLIAVVISIILMAYNAIQYTNFEKLLSKPEIYGMIVALNAMFIFFAHILFLVTVVMIIRHIRELRWVNMAILVLGIVSLTAVFGHWGSLTDIAKELPAGLEVQSEIWAITLAMIVHFSFFIVLFFYLLYVRKLVFTRTLTKSTIMSENLYLVMHIVGILCAGMGLLHVASEYTLNISIELRKWFVLPFMIVVLLPYMIVMLSWIYHTIRERKAGYADEKQILDIFRAGLTAWLVSLPVMILLFIFQYHNLTGIICIMWLPIFVYVSLLVFSISSLVFYKGA